MANTNGRRAIFAMHHGSTVRLAAVFATLALWFGSGRISVVADVMQEQTSHRHVELAVSSLLRKEHISRRPLDDTISKRAFEMFVKRLDPLKAFFLKSDIEEFQGYSTQIDDAVRRGDMQIARKIFARFLQRVDERTDSVQRLLDAGFDFTVDESLETDPDEYDYVASQEEANERWRKRLKYEILLQKADGLSLEEARDKMLRRYRSFALRNHQTDGDELLETFLSSVTESFDPHTTYMAPSSHENFEIWRELARP
jgi:carboxyl-terminal processing protease